MFEWFSGKKTYLVALVTFIVGGLEALGGAGMIDWQTPSWLYATRGALGLLALRAGVKKIETNND